MFANRSTTSVAPCRRTRTPAQKSRVIFIPTCYDMTILKSANNLTYNAPIPRPNLDVQPVIDELVPSNPPETCDAVRSLAVWLSQHKFTP